jgi:hypothetical protein
MEQPPVGYLRVETTTIYSPEAIALAQSAHSSSPPDPTVSLKDWMAPELLEAWKIIARDLETPDAIIPLVLPNDWDEQESYACAMVSWQDGSGAGISVPRHEPLPVRVVYLADQFQESEVEALWSAGRSAVWPHCPRHPNTHPLNARLHNGVAVWVCGEFDVIASIGELFPR